MHCVEHEIRAIRPHVSLSSRQLNTVYLPTLERSRATRHDDAFDVAVRAIRLRRGYIIPYGAAPEDAVHDSEKWTFALFVCALRAYRDDTLSQAEALAWVRETIPVSALDWVGPHVGRIMLRAISGESVPGYPLLKIISLATLRMACGSSHVIDHSMHADVDDFFEWLIREIDANRQRINLKSSSIHVVPDGLLIDDDLLARYQKENRKSLERDHLIRSPHFVGFSRYHALHKGRSIPVGTLVLRPNRDQLSQLPINPSLRVIGG